MVAIGGVAGSVEFHCSQGRITRSRPGECPAYGPVHRSLIRPSRRVFNVLNAGGIHGRVATVDDRLDLGVGGIGNRDDSGLRAVGLESGCQFKSPPLLPRLAERNGNRVALSRRVRVRNTGYRKAPAGI